MFRAMLAWSRVRGGYDSESQYHTLSPDSANVTGLFLLGEYGLMKRLAVGGLLTVLHSRREVALDSAASTGLGDAFLFTRANLIAETAGGWPETTLIFRLKLPTGRAEGAHPESLGTDLRGTGSTDLSLGLMLTKGIRPLLLHANLLYTVSFPCTLDGVKIHYGDSLNWALAGEYPIPGTRFGLVLEMNGRHQARREQDSQPLQASHQDAVLINAGVQVSWGAALMMNVGYQRTLWGANTGALDSALLSLRHVF